jgi:site-specific recombinase XerD
VIPAAPESGLSRRDWERHIEGWLLDGEIRQLSPRTLEERRNVTGKLLWFLTDRELPACGTPEFRAFLAYVNTGHEQERGRWGNPKMTRKVSARTAKAYYRVLAAFCRWLVEEGAFSASPLAGFRPPVVRADQVQPFTDAQVEALLDAAKKSSLPTRNLALFWFLIDTGCRASEVCAATVADLDLSGRKVRIRGKGNKERMVFLGRHATKALFTYLREQPREDAAALFVSERGKSSGDPLTRAGLDYQIRTLGREARIEGVRCSAHVFRHYAAVSFLRAGGNVFALKELLGHTTLDMTQKYVRFVAADVQAQHRLFSPGDRLKAKR